MSSYATTAGWAPRPTRRRGPSRRGLEIAGIILGFIFVWPLALAYLVWKVLGYPVPEALRVSIERHVGNLFGDARTAPFYAGTGNAAFEDYRRGELARLEAERRRLDQEARDFAAYVDELKRAKDREEFDAFMRKRRDESGTANA